MSIPQATKKHAGQPRKLWVGNEVVAYPGAYAPRPPPPKPLEHLCASVPAIFTGPRGRTGGPYRLGGVFRRAIEANGRRVLREPRGWDRSPARGGPARSTP